MIGETTICDNLSRGLLSSKFSKGNPTKFFTPLASLSPTIYNPKDLTNLIANY